MKKKLFLKKKESQDFLKSIATINDAAILVVNEDSVESLVSSPDNRIYLLATMSGDFEDFDNLNIPSLRKLSSALDMADSDDIELVLNSNNLEYTGSNIKFKYHLCDDGILNKSNISAEKIRKFSYDYEFSVSNMFLKSLIKSAAIFKATNKLYISTNDDGHIVWSIEDKTTANVDTMTIVGDSVDFELDTPYIMTIECLNQMALSDKSGYMNVSINNKVGVASFELITGNTSLNYIVTSLIN